MPRIAVVISWFVVSLATCLAVADGARGAPIPPTGGDASGLTLSHGYESPKYLSSAVNQSPGWEDSAFVTGDGKQLYWAYSNLIPGQGANTAGPILQNNGSQFDMYRMLFGSSWGSPEHLPTSPYNTLSAEGAESANLGWLAFMRIDGKRKLFGSKFDGSGGLSTSTVALGVNSTCDDDNPHIAPPATSSGRFLLYFDSWRKDGGCRTASEGPRIWVSEFSGTTENDLANASLWSTPTLVSFSCSGEVPAMVFAVHPFLTNDLKTLYWVGFDGTSSSANCRLDGVENSNPCIFRGTAQNGPVPSTFGSCEQIVRAKSHASAATGEVYQLGEPSLTDNGGLLYFVAARDVSYGAGLIQDPQIAYAQRFVLDQPAASSGAVLRVGGSVQLSGAGITSGSVLKVYLATSSGVIDVIPNGLSPTSTTAGTWQGTLPWPWPVAAPNDKNLGLGYVSLSLVRTDRGYDQSNSVGIPLIGNPSLGTNAKVPSILAVNNAPFAATSWDVGIHTANAEVVVQSQGTVTLDSESASLDGLGPVVNVFHSTGNCGPLTPTFPNGSSRPTVTLPSSCPTGPVSFQIVNVNGAYATSNTVAAQINAVPQVTGVSLSSPCNGTSCVVTVNGNGLSPQTVVNLFANNGSGTVNFGGLTGGTPNIAITFVSEHQITFHRPAGVQSGSAFVQVLNAPFSAYFSSTLAPSSPGAFSF